MRALDPAFDAFEARRIGDEAAPADASEIVGDRPAVEFAHAAHDERPDVGVRRNGLAREQPLGDDFEIPHRLAPKPRG